jgi:Domain of unknown function (DUF6438)
MKPLMAGVRVAAVLAFVAVAGCNKQTQAGADTANASAPQDDAAAVASVDTGLVISLERGPCRGRCPVYRVDIYGNGDVRFDGKQHVGTLGAQRGSAPVAAVQDLLRAIQNSEFSSVDTSFVMDSPGCGQYMADLPWSRLAARVGTAMKTVHHDPGCQSAPRFLRTLEAQVDSVAGTARWTAINGDAGK